MTFNQALELFIALLPITSAMSAVLYKYLVIRFAPFFAKHPTLLQLVNIGVVGAEQEFQGSSGAEKKQAVVNFLSVALKRYGITVDPAIVSFMIEAAVADLKATQTSSVVLSGNPPPQPIVPTLPSN